MTKDLYSQMAKNTVDSKNQLNESRFVRFHHLGGNGVRIMFMGNSITLHGSAPSIGWLPECGMAASAPEKDYVHILEGEVLDMFPDAAFCICQVAEWERNYKQGADKHALYESARIFDADVIVIRFIENCPGGDFDGEVFYKSVEELINYVNADGKAKIIVTTGFWRHPGDAQLIRFAKENSWPLIELGDLGERDEMKAIGLFEHSGVANHPGDAGMKNIAERIAKDLLPICR
ncbi:MAG: SGNH/GDSL hydrolase family protein [Clostridia bacterium]|nr:SGNH/GDSL hydrolase family protein [Clostridia bacterium]